MTSNQRTVVHGRATGNLLVYHGSSPRVGSRSRCQNMSAVARHTDAIGQALQIIGIDQTVDMNNLKPILTLTLLAGAVNVGWTKQGMDAVEIFVNRGDGKGFSFVSVDTVPDYTCNSINHQL